jgi:hypothetical protein
MDEHNLPNVASTELKTATPFQVMLHFPSFDDPNESVPSKFSVGFVKTSWSTNLSEKLSSNTSSDDSKMVEYSANHKFDYLLYTYMCMNMPQIKVLAEFEEFVQICLPHNLAHNVIKDGYLCYDDEPKQNINPIWLDVNSQLFMKSKPNAREFYNIMIGNVPFLEEWTNSLPAYPLTCPQPWSYCSHLPRAIPLFLCSKSRVKHRYSLRTLSEILRMRVRKRVKDENGDYIPDEYGEWVPIKPNERYLEGTVVLPKPELWGRYAKITDGEKDWRSDNIKDREVNMLPHSIYTEDIIMTTSPNEVRLGSEVIMELYSKTPVKAAFWVAENIDSTKFNNYSNYTTDPNIIFNGWNPIKSYQLNYGTMKRIPERSHNHADQAEPWYHFPSCPVEPGYNACAMSYDPSSIHADVGLIFSENLKTNLTLKMGDTDPFLIKSGYLKKSSKNPNFEDELDELKDNVASGCKFKIHAILLVYKKLEFNNDTVNSVIGPSNMPNIPNTPMAPLTI